MNYLVRQTVDYSIVIEAETEEEAIRKAEAIDLSDWTEEWSPYEADKEGDYI